MIKVEENLFKKEEKLIDIIFWIFWNFILNFLKCKICCGDYLCNVIRIKFVNGDIIVVMVVFVIFYLNW